MVDAGESLSHNGGDSHFRLPGSRFAIYFLIISAYLAFRLWRLTDYGLIGDEVFSYQLASDSWSGLIQSAISDVVHPPLFYILLKMWIIAGGNSLFWVKLFPVACSLFSIPPFILLCRELGLKTDAIKLALWLMAVNEFLINFSQELRMYSQAMLFAILSLWLFARIYNSDGFSKSLNVWLLFANLLLVYTHYYGWFIPVLEMIFLLLKKDQRIRGFIISLAALVLCFIPWAYFVSRASMAKGGLGANLDWNNPPTAIDLIWYYAILHGPLTHRWNPPWKSLAALLISAAFVYPILLLIRRNAQSSTLKSRLSENVFMWLAIFSFLPPLLSFALSQILKHSVWGIRYLIIAAPAYLILVSFAALKLRWPLLRRATVGLILLWATASGLALTLRKDKIAIAPMASRMIEAEYNQTSPISVYTNQAVIGYTLQYYLESQAPQRFEVVYVDDYASIREAHFWVAFIKYRYDNQKLPQEQMDSENYSSGEEIAAETFTQKVFLFPVWRKPGL